MIKLSVKKSKKLESLMDNETWIQRFLRSFAEKFNKKWNQLAGSKLFWILGRHSKKFPPARPDILTVRSGRLVNAARGKSESFTNITVRPIGFEINKTLFTPYANRQERWAGGARAFMAPSAEESQTWHGEEILEEALKESLA